MKFLYSHCTKCTITTQWDHRRHLLSLTSLLQSLLVNRCILRHRLQHR